MVDSPGPFWSPVNRRACVEEVETVQEPQPGEAKHA